MVFSDYFLHSQSQWAAVSLWQQNLLCLCFEFNYHYQWLLQKIKSSLAAVRSINFHKRYVYVHWPYSQDCVKYFNNNGDTQSEQSVGQSIENFLMCDVQYSILCSIDIPFSSKIWSTLSYQSSVSYSSDRCNFFPFS